MKITGQRVESVKKFVMTHLWWIAMMFAVGMLLAHAFSFSRVKVDNTSIILLIIVALCPYVSAIKKIKLGEFEAEIDPEEVKRIRHEVEAQAISESATNALLPPPPPAFDDILILAQSDHILALAKIRIELEKLLSRIYRSVIPSLTEERPLPITQLVQRIAAEGVISPQTARSIRDVASICNRAIHGDDIRDSDALLMVETGVSLLSELARIADDYNIEATEVTVIDRKSVEAFEEARYRVVTITPLTKNPTKSVRIVNQEALTYLLTDYEKYAEFVVEVSKLQ